MKKDLKESLRTYVKRFKVEKAKIVGCDGSIASSTFRKGLPSDHPLFKELIMGENLTMANSYTLIFCDLTNKLWFKITQLMKEDTSKMD
ncbi:hypothetical protein ACFX19_028278 [Malus domestica]